MDNEKNVNSEQIVNPANDPKEIGRTLQKSRKSKGVTFETAHRATHVSMRYLHALENGDFSQFPAEVYITGSLRRYGAYLGLDTGKLLDDYYTLTGHKKENQLPAVSSGKPHARLLFVIIIAVTALIGAAMLLLKTHVAGPSSTPAPSIQIAPPIEKSTTAPGTITTKKEPDQLKLEIKSTEDSWVRILSDGVLLFEGIIYPGKPGEWTAKNDFLVKIGYTPGVKIKLNGVDIDATRGDTQDVNTIILNHNSLKNNKQ